MAETGQPQGTSMSTAQAASAFEALLTRVEEGQSEAETLTGEEPEPEAEVEELPEGEPEAETEEGSEPEPEAEIEEEQKPETHVVKIDGVEVPVTLDELKNGYQRDADYRRKTATLAEERRALEPEKQALAAERARVAEQMTALEKLLEQPLYDPNELAELRHTNPAEYAARMTEIQARDNAKQQLASERQRQEQLAQAQQQAQQRQTLLETQAQEQAKLFAAKPEWKDAAKRDAALAQMKSVLVQVGFDANELDGILDHRLILLLDKAAKQDVLEKKAPQTKAKVEAVKTAKPGVAGQQKSQVSEVTRARQRLAQTGRVEDAAALFLQRLGSG